MRRRKVKLSEIIREGLFRMSVAGVLYGLISVLIYSFI